MNITIAQKKSELYVWKDGRALLMDGKRWGFVGWMDGWKDGRTGCCL
jgi:hypothetical protein